jgi:hypothetical protein
MEAVSLHQTVVARRAVEEEGMEDHAVARGEIGINRAKRLDIVLAQVARRFHACEQDRQPPRLQLFDDGRERSLRALWRQALQRIVGAKLDDDGARIVGQSPVEPREPRRSGIAGDARIHNPRRDAARLQRRLELRREGLILRQPEACGQAVAERHDHRRFRRGSPAIKRGEEEEAGGQSDGDRDTFHLFDLIALL